MKTLAVSMILALGLAAPALAQQTPPAKTAIQADDSTPMDELIAEASSEDRMKLMMRCAGPPPKVFPKAVASTEPKSEPAIVASSGGSSDGG
jgi:hypothetical protein